MNDNDEKMKEEIEELNNEIKKYNEMISEENGNVDDSEESQIEEESNEVNENEEIKEEKSEIVSDSKKSNKSNIVIGLLVIILLLVTLTSFYEINKLKKSSKKVLKSVEDYSEEEKIISGITQKEQEKDSTKQVIKQIEEQEEIKKENINNSKNYEKYQNLSEEEKKKSEVIPDKENKSIELIDDIKEEIDILDNIPSKYNLKDHIKLVVDNQYSYGLCWDFATLESIETNYQIKNKKEINLSEIAVDYLASKELFGYRDPHEGGAFSLVLDRANIKGVKKEEKNEYRDWNEKEIWGLLDQYDKYYITDHVDFPSVNKEEGIANVSEEQLKEFRDLVKSHIIQNGSIYAVIDGNIGNDKHVFRYDGAYPNHAVSIVGWDDTYPKENFTDLNSGVEKHPIHDGAYIIKNSWGEGYGDKGYYYVSYDDQLIESELRGVLSTDTSNKHYLEDLPKYLKEFIQENNGHLIKHDKKGDYVFNSTLKSITYLLITEKAQITQEEFDRVIELLPQLSSVSIDNSNITDISSLTGLNNLSYLDIINGNKIIDYAVIGQIKSLRGLYIENTNLSDISFVSSLVNLTSISIKNANITDVSPLANLKLHTVILDNNNISDISILQNDENIHYLSLANNPGIVGYNNFPNVYYLNLSGCEIYEIDTLHLNNDTGLYLVLSNNHLTKLPIIDTKDQANPDEPLYYHSIIAENNNIDSLSGLNKNAVYYLNLENNNLSDLSKLNDYFIKSINLSNNNIKDTSGINGKKMENIVLSNNKEIVITKDLNSLRNVVLDNCNIKDLKDILVLNNVEYLSLNNNEISSLDGLEKLEKLESLYLNNNQINSLENVSNSNLLQLYLQNNKIETALGIEKFEKLTTLDLSENPIKDLSSISKLKYLDFLYLNKIGKVDVSDFSFDNGKASISLEENNIKGVLKGKWNIINIKDSIGENLNINDAIYSYLNIEGVKGDISYDKLIPNIIKREDKAYISLTLNDNYSISLDNVYDVVNSKNVFAYINGGKVIDKRELNNKQYPLDDVNFRKMLVKSYAFSKRKNCYFNDTFTSLIPVNPEEDSIIKFSYKGGGFGSVSSELHISSKK